MTQQTGDWNTLVPVTGEAVALDLRLAQFPSRMLALFLDLLIQFVLLFLVIFLVGTTLSGVDDAAAAAITITMLVVVIVGVPTFVETLTRGRSLGKMAAGLRVVRDDGGPVRFRHAFVRALFMVVDFWLTSGAVGLIASLASQRGKRVGDQFAGTVVIRERVPGAAQVVQHAYAMPPGMEAWAASVPTSRGCPTSPPCRPGSSSPAPPPWSRRYASRSGVSSPPRCRRTSPRPRRRPACTRRRTSPPC